MKSLKVKHLTMLLLSAFLVACSSDVEVTDLDVEKPVAVEEVNVEETEAAKETEVEVKVEKPEEKIIEPKSNKSTSDNKQVNNTQSVDTKNYQLIKVDGGDTSGHRKSNVVVNIGHGNRDYWAYTNEHGQLVRVTAEKIIVQNDTTEDVNSSGRYYSKMADVPGVGADTGYDRGHVIADSLGGVANAYNITPQEATLNRHGDQAYMEKVIRDAGGATDFEAIISYPDTKTQIPSKYKFTYTIKGNKVVDEFENTNPDKTNEKLGLTKPNTAPKPAPKNDSIKSESSGDLNAQNVGNVQSGDVTSVDTNGNGRVTIKEAKDAGFSMPIYRGHWLYEYMDDRDGDGTVGE